MINLQVGDKALSERLLQASFVQYLQALHTYQALGLKNMEKPTHGHIDLPKTRVELLIRTAETCESLLTRIPEQSLRMSEIEAQVLGMERDLHSLVIMLRRLLFTVEGFEMERLAAAIDQQIQNIRRSYWEAIDWFEQRGYH